MARLNPKDLVLAPVDFQERWARKMVEIWTDRIIMLGAFTKEAHLLRSVALDGAQLSQEESQITFHFLEYGIYVDAGTGRGYKRGNGGDLYFLGKEYRKKHKLGKPRERRPWFSKSWNISLRVMANYMQHKLADEYAGLFDNLAAER